MITYLAHRVNNNNENGKYLLCLKMSLAKMVLLHLVHRLFDYYYYLLLLLLLFILP